jgi:Flp pilus assembly protein TadG
MQTIRGRTRRREQSGQALVEFALVLPLLLVLLLGMLDFGKAFNYWIDETHLAHEGARWAAVNVNPGSGTLQQYILSQADTVELRNGGTDSVPSAAQVCITFPSNPVTGTQGQVGDPVTVTVQIPTYAWMPFIGNRLKIGVLSPLQSSSTMRLEALPTNYTQGCS